MVDYTREAGVCGHGVSFFAVFLSYFTRHPRLSPSTILMPFLPLLFDTLSRTLCSCLCTTRRVV